METFEAQFRIEENGHITHLLTDGKAGVNIVPAQNPALRTLAMQHVESKISELNKTKHALTQV